MKRMGEITVYWGSMFSGKTSALIEDLINAGEGAVCFKPLVDNRDPEDLIKTHDGVEFPATTIKEASQILYELDYGVTTVGIEEASLFMDDPTLLPTIELLRNRGLDVIVTGLDMTSEGEPFGQMPHIAAISDNCLKFHASCAECTDFASISYYKKGKKDTVAVGGADKYLPLCRECWSAKL
ncbi:thymidine kinase [Peribacillus frigoritolerans]|uniref:Thymidine kinase n=1 Tax=Peribacillus castrilensis TaxID=2897690 RepID=A0AAW9NQ18_9BACI|nr:hypothetical protein [Peribacillus castrilensis]